MVNYSDIFPQGDISNSDPFVNNVVLVKNFERISDLNFFGNLNGSPSITSEQSKWGTGSLKLSTSSWIDITNGVQNVFNGDFTLEVWLYPLSVSTDQLIISSATSPNTFSTYFFLLQLGINGSLRTAIGNGVASYLSDLTSVTGVIAVNAWSFIQVVASGNNIESRVNNSVVTSASSLTGTRIHISKNYRIGRLGTSVDRFMNGYLGGLRLTKAARAFSIPNTRF